MLDVEAPQMPKTEKQEVKDSQRIVHDREKFMTIGAEDEFNPTKIDATAVWDNALFELEGSTETNFEDALKKAAQANDIEAIPAQMKQHLLIKLEEAVKLQKKIQQTEEKLAMSQVSKKEGVVEGQLSSEAQEMAGQLLEAYKQKLEELRP